MKIKRPCEFSLHEYMDEYPQQQVRIFEGESLEDIEKLAKEWADYMTKNYSGGPTTFIKVWSYEETNAWFIKQIKSLRQPLDAADSEWMESTRKAFVECFPEHSIFMGVTPY